MTLITGKHGAVLVDGQAVAEVVQWSLTTNARTVAYSSSATGGAVRRMVTARTAAGKIAFLMQRNAPQQSQWAAGQSPLAAGQSVTLQLVLEAGNVWQVPAVIERLEIDVDISQAAGVPSTATFISDGNWTPP